MTRIIFGFILAISLNATVTLDNWQVGSNNGGGGNTTWTHTNNCSSNCVGYVLVSSISSSTTFSTSTWGGAAMTLVTSHARSYGPNGSGTFYIFCIVAPGSGAQTVSITPASGWALTTSVTFSGANQSCSANTNAFQEATSSPCPFNSTDGMHECPVTITPSASNAYVFAMFSPVGGAFINTTSTGTYRLQTNLYSDYFVFDSNGVVSGAYTINEP